MLPPVTSSLPEAWPTGFPDEAALEEWLTRPRPELVAAIRHVASPLLVLGAAGKMGPTLCRLAQRAALDAGHDLEVIAVSRFRDQAVRRQLEGQGITVQAADLLDPAAVRDLPEASDILCMPGQKFGTARHPAATWATNLLAATHVAERFPHARIVALSTGNVYPLVPVKGGGATEDLPLHPVGEYPASAVGRERLWQHFATANGTRVALIRLNYAVDLRYGVLVDIGRKILAGEPIDLTMGHFNCIWQGDANEAILRALELAATPAAAWNLTGTDTLRVRTVAEALARRLKRPVRFTGQEAETALLSNPGRLVARLGPPPTPRERVLDWTADWLAAGRPLWDKPTHFEVRNGTY